MRKRLIQIINHNTKSLKEFVQTSDRVLFEEIGDEEIDRDLTILTQEEDVFHIFNRYHDFQKFSMYKCASKCANSEYRN
jgi:hypothetical protein